MKRFRNSFGFLKGLALLVVLAMGLLYPGLVSAAGTAVVSVSAPGEPVDPGEQFIISVVVEPNNAIAGVQFDLSFDPSVVTADEVREGDLLTQGGASAYFNPGTIDNQAGTITGVFGAITSPGQTVSGVGTFAVITLTAETEGGTSPLTLSSVVIGDIEGNPVSVNVVNGTISVNRPPVLNPIGNKSVNEGQLLEFTISATDPNGDSLTYSASNLPSGVSFDPQTRTFSWSPGYNQAGAYPDVHFEVSDGSLTDSEDITITVNNVYQPDVNGDGVVNVLDMILVGQHWGETGPSGWMQEDIKEDGVVNVLDAILIGQQWTG